MQNLLPELADALHRLRGERQPRTVVSSLDLWQQFALPITPSCWRDLGEQLGCVLPELRRRTEGLWGFPARVERVLDLVEWVRRAAGQEPISEVNVAIWEKAQIFAGVRSCLVDALNIDPEEVVPKARLMDDLGAM
jgi:hypothetical protein